MVVPRIRQEAFGKEVWKMKKLLLLVVLLMVLAGGCIKDVDASGSNSYGRFYYYYDEAHDVSIWIWSHPYGGGISVLPARQVYDPDVPMKLRK